MGLSSSIPYYDLEQEVKHRIVEHINHALKKFGVKNVPKIS